MRRAPRTLLSAGEPAWGPLNEEKRKLLRPAPDATVEELLRRGTRLSRQAGRLRRAIQAGRGASRS